MKLKQIHLLSLAIILLSSCAKKQINDLYKPRSPYEFANMDGITVKVSSTQEQEHVMYGFSYYENSVIDFNTILKDTLSEVWFNEVDELMTKGNGLVVVFVRSHSYYCCDGIQESKRFVLIDFKSNKILEIDRYPTTNYFYGDIKEVDSLSIISKGFHNYTRNEIDFHKVFILEDNGYNFDTIQRKVRNEIP